MLMKAGNKITLIFEESTCSMVKEGVNNSYLYDCTTGYPYTKGIGVPW